MAKQPSPSSRRERSEPWNPFFKSNSTIAPHPNPSPAYGRGTKPTPQSAYASKLTQPQTLTLARKRERVRDSVGEGQRLFIYLNFKQFTTALATAWVLACSLPVFALEITYFYDGDTVKIKDDAGYEYKLRITDIDAPERNQTYGLKSRRALMQLCLGANIHVTSMGYDKYQRKLGRLKCYEQDASQFMVKNGHAWFNRRYSMDYTLDLAEQEARKNKLGLWKAKQQTPPWVWRKNHPH